MLMTLAVASTAPAHGNDAETFFETRIRPVLATKCFKCHGGETDSSGLRVDSREALLQGGDSGAAVVPGDAAASLLVQAIRRGEDLQMPPEEALTAEQVADFERWIADGAYWPAATAGEPAMQAERHWAFEPVREVSIPADPSGTAETPIDRFIQTTLTEHGLHPQPAADPATLLRRLFFDLVGLPPEPQAIEAFVRDPSPAAYDAVVERLLASPAYGERWGRHWMDVVRYADTAGDNADYPVPEARLYRDYIIDAFNDDKPYDQFLREQLAGDILAQREPQKANYAERVAATGYLALSRRYATGPYELWHLTLEDAIDTTGRAVLGLSLRCARCHDHKFDPVTTEDYYALYGIFASTQFPWAGAEELQSKSLPRQHFQPLLPPEKAEPLLAAGNEAIAALEAAIERTNRDDPDAQRVAQLDAQLKAGTANSAGEGDRGQAEAAKNELAALEQQRSEAQRRLQSKLDKMNARLRALKRRGAPDDVPLAYAVTEGQPADAAVQHAGEPSDPGEVVPRGVPKFLDGGRPIEIPAGSSGRLELARWLTRPDHPLTARVMVNRVWQHHFGKGLVGTPSDLGLRGEPPTHPQLLDWLARQFVADGWSIKNLHRRIVRSQTYQRASGHDAEAEARDPANRWYWRFDRRRLEAEAIRDAMLTVGGNLDRRPASEHPFPPMADWGWTQHTPFKAVYPSQRRSVYLMTQRLIRHPYLALFDGPDPNVSTAKRTSATVPPQALFLMNNPFVAEQAAAFADRMRASSEKARDRIAWAYLSAYGRPVKSDECDRALAYLDAFAAESASAGATREEAQREAWASYARVLLTSNEFVYVE